MSAQDKRASKSKFRTHDKVCPAFFWITFHFTSSVYLYVSYKMKISVSLWRRANARNVRLHYPYWQYTDLFIFRFVSLLCLRSTLRLYKMKTCTQISDSGFREKINVVNPGDSAKRASPPAWVGFSHVNARWNPVLLLGLALPRGLALLHINTPLERCPLSERVVCKHLPKYAVVYKQRLPVLTKS